VLQQPGGWTSRQRRRLRGRFTERSAWNNREASAIRLLFRCPIPASLRHLLLGPIQERRSCDNTGENYQGNDGYDHLYQPLTAADRIAGRSDEGVAKHICRCGTRSLRATIGLCLTDKTKSTTWQGNPP
jgi:hypothetical protein